MRLKFLAMISFLAVAFELTGAYSTSSGASPNDDLKKNDTIKIIFPANCTKEKSGNFTVSGNISPINCTANVQVTVYNGCNMIVSGPIKARILGPCCVVSKSPWVAEFTGVKSGGPYTIKATYGTAPDAVITGIYVP